MGYTVFYWVFNGFYHVLLGLSWFSRVLLSFTEFQLVILGFTGFYWVLLGSTRFSWVTPCFTGFLIGFTMCYRV